MFCNNCGRELRDGAKFCPGCGTQVSFTYAEDLDYYGNQDNNNYGGQSYNNYDNNYGGQGYNNNYGGQNYNNYDNNYGGQGYNNNYGSQNYNNNYGGQSYNNYDNNYGGQNYNNYDNNYGGQGYNNNYGGQNYNSYGSSNNNGEAKGFFTAGNIERFAPVAAFIPLVMAIICGILIGFLQIGLWRVAAARVIIRVLLVVFRFIFVVVTLAATGGLVYVIITKNYASRISAWIAPACTLFAAVSCIGIVFRWKVVAWIFGVIAFIIGIELLARIVIAGRSVASNFDPAGAFSTFGRYYKDYRAKNPTTKDLERSGYVDPENSKFDGAGIELFGYTILTAIVCIFTLGIAAPWMICKIYRWQISHTVINGKRLTFTGTGGSLLGHWILWEILTIITIGIYGFFVHTALRRWELKHTFIEGEPVRPDAEESTFDGSTLGYIGHSILCGLLCIVTLGIGYPWAMAMVQRWDTKHQIINRRRLVFSGTGLGFLGEYIIIFLLTLVTLGIYSTWGTVRMNKYIIRHTDFVS